MKNILIITSGYSGAVSASGFCTRMIVDELKKRGHNIFILSIDDEKKENDVYTTTISRNKRDGMVYSLFRRLGSLLFPINDKNVEKELINKTFTICKMHNIDALICVYFPLESISLLARIKKTYPFINTVVYELDSVGDGIFASSKINLLAKNNYEKWMNCNYNYADSIIIMRSHERYWKKTFGGRYIKKLLVSDIPVLRDCTQKNHKKNRIPIVLYGGMLGRRYRSPNGFLMIFHELTKLTKVSLDFYSKGDCEEIISSYARSNPNVSAHGYVAQDILDDAINQADVLLSIGNRVSNSIPSKLITYFSYGKPVIHIASQRNDICEEYVNRYPLGLVLHEWDSPTDNAKKTYNFLKDSIGVSIPYSVISRSLYMNTPNYNVNLIERAIRM